MAGAAQSRFCEATGSEPLHEFDQQLVDLPRPLLLHPMTASAEHLRTTQPRQRLAEVSDRRATPSCRPVLLATDEQRRHGDWLPRVVGQIFPVAVHVAISIESAGEAG